MATRSPGWHFTSAVKKGSEGAAEALPFSVGHMHAEAFESGVGGVAGASVQQHRRKRRIGIRIDAFGDARRIGGEPNRFRRARLRRHSGTPHLERHEFVPRQTITAA